MRVSYVRRVKDQSTFTADEIKVLKKTYEKAIHHGHTDVIEELLSRGMPLTSVLDHNKTSLRVAIECDQPKVFENLLIESMRTFQLFPYQDVMDALKWMIHKAHYNLVALTVFALEQNPVSHKKYSYFIDLNHFMDKFVELCAENKCEAAHFEKFKNLLKIKKLSKEELYYFYNVWERELVNSGDNALKLYAILASSYDDLECQKINDLSYHKKTKMIFKITVITFAVGIFYYQIDRFYGNPLMFNLAFLVTLLALGISYYCYKDIMRFEKKQQYGLYDIKLLKACRDGDEKEVIACLDLGAHLNKFMGIAHATPLYEATRFGHEPIIALLRQFGAYTAAGSLPKGSLWDYTLTTPNQKPFPLAAYHGKAKAVLLVNIASRCDFTPQLGQLEELHQQYKDKGLIIIAVPSNNFLGTEPLDDEYITEFCQINYGTTFLIMGKTHLIQEGAHPLYAWLNHHTKPKWNFQKYIFDHEGHLVESFEPSTPPTSQAMNNTIKQLLEL